MPSHFFALRGSKTAPDGSLTQQFHDMKEAQKDEREIEREIAEAKKQQLANFREVVRVRPKERIAQTAEERNEQLLVLIEELNARIEALETQDMEAKKKELVAYAGLKRTANQLVCGGLAGAIARTTVAPIDRVKILLQTQHLVHAGRIKYTGIVQTMSTIMQEEGLKGLWRGNGVNIVRVVPYSATQFASYDVYKQFIMGDREMHTLSTVERLCAGGLAGMTATSVTHPLDVIRLRLSVNPDLAGPVAALKDVLSENGARSLMKGYTPTLMSLGPFIAINFASFDTFKQWAYPDGSLQKEPWKILMLGACAGLFAQTCCYPLDTIRRRMQLKGQNYDNTLDCIRKILRTEGPAGFYRGMLPNALKVVPQNSIRFVAFEMLRTVFGVEKKKVGGGGD
eukprot:gb/GEZN01008887.1/.p1 GENE.gb/GEZN01008887.1/~~gb/GEZN01008887.1/.p1  ORF type:complete len:397 (-),score=76.07 gb/GEZN01008887.1/:135-1325(-)